MCRLQALLNVVLRAGGVSTMMVNDVELNGLLLDNSALARNMFVHIWHVALNIYASVLIGGRGR